MVMPVASGESPFNVSIQLRVGHTLTSPRIRSPRESDHLEGRTESPVDSLLMVVACRFNNATRC